MPICEECGNTLPTTQRKKLKRFCNTRCRSMWHVKRREHELRLAIETLEGAVGRIKGALPRGKNGGGSFDPRLRS